jgi:predicted Zn-dependent protease
MAAYTGGSTVLGVLPFSRLQESEADELGLTFMAIAGYNPQEAPEFWKRMQAQSGGGAPPEFLSTHPSGATRIKDLNKWMSSAMKYYEKSNKTTNSKISIDQSQLDQAPSPKKEVNKKIMLNVDN